MGKPSLSTITRASVQLDQHVNWVFHTDCVCRALFVWVAWVMVAPAPRSLKKAGFILLQRDLSYGKNVIRTKQESDKKNKKGLHKQMIAMSLMSEYLGI